MRDLTSSQSRSPATRFRMLKVVLWSGLIAVMGLGFMGYLMPGVRMSWETIVTLCGF